MQMFRPVSVTEIKAKDYVWDSSCQLSRTASVLKAEKQIISAAHVNSAHTHNTQLLLTSKVQAFITKWESSDGYFLMWYEWINVTFF